MLFLKESLVLISNLDTKLNIHTNAKAIYKKGGYGALWVSVFCHHFDGAQ